MAGGVGPRLNGSALLENEKKKEKKERLKEGDAPLSREHDGNWSSTGHPAAAESSSSSSRSCLVSKATVSQSGGMVGNVVIVGSKGQMMTLPVASWKVGCDWLAVGQVSS